jgi:hypothetical protein
MAKYSNTWTRIADSDGGAGLGITTDGEREQARFMDSHAAKACACGGQYKYRPTVGCMMCPECGDMLFDGCC